MKGKRWLFGGALLAAGVVACSSSIAGGAGTPTTTGKAVDSSLFLATGLAKSITEEACTLSGGTKSTCYRIVTSATPSGINAGPWCPSTITSSAEEGGIWLEGGKVYDVDGAFIKNLSTLYNDSEFKLYNDDGTVRITDTKEAFEAAARPDVAAAYNNYCVQGQLSYIADGTVNTFIIPKTPVAAAKTSSIGGDGVGVAFNGVRFDPPAPTDAILAAHTIAPFDDCGGHINPHTGYHYHASTGCPTEISQTDGHAPLIGYAMDGYGLYTHLNADGSTPTDLDASGGHTDDVRGYHYHMAEAGTNSFINSFHGETGCAATGDTTGTACDATASTGRPGGGPPPGGAPPTN